MKRFPEQAVVDLIRAARPSRLLNLCEVFEYTSAYFSTLPAGQQILSDQRADAQRAE